MKKVEVEYDDDFITIIDKVNELLESENLKVEIADGDDGFAIMTLEEKEK